MIGLVGKLPAHGDFVRRGGPASILVALDRWLDVELSRAPELVDAMDGWRFAVRVDGQDVLGTIVASEDAVGRRFPVIATVSTMADDQNAEAWCAQASGVLARERHADAAIAALSTPAKADGEPAVGWWHADGRASWGEAVLPTGDAFARLFGEASP